MQTKQCQKCKEDICLSKFKYKNIKRKHDRVRRATSYCKSCWNVHYSGSFNLKKEHRGNLLDRNRLFIKDLLKKSKCIDCGHDDWRVLEFDHLPKFDKSNDISDMLYRNSIQSIKEEIEKCEIVCSNCHSLRSFSRAKSWRMLND